MPASPPRLTLPLGLLFYDAVGTVLFALGAARHFAGLDVIPEQYLWPGYAVPFMVAGLAMMVPLVMHIVRHGKAMARSPGGASRFRR
ncbi:MAG: hypothetical protein HKO62_14220 [Gammaproteobacteria bacterium]|nr:hypothetical protein [Gammaproteobacteria bacterium]NNM01906.1 hypothetical protein [Gammaproteobacteria bacterium]